ncbi:MAG: TMEM165/GDT1 family protein [Actinobacteria bacterium]|nr:TMEM165/GDT1 family protein [Actinomycetota bacterium]
MNLAVIAAVFPVIFLGELPDKTMIASVVMAARSRASWVWLGAAAAFAVHVVIATTLGVIVFRLLPRQAVDIAAAVIFLAGAVLTAREALRRRDEDEAEPSRTPQPAGRAALAAFVVIFVAEWGDLTQLLIVNLAARFHDPVAVGLGATAALWAAAGLAVLGGRGLLRVVSASVIRIATAVILTGLAAYSAWTAFT